MQFMEDRIIKDGRVKEGNILKADNFLNHQLDVAFLTEAGNAFYDHFRNRNINKILTVEASGIAVACMTAQYFQVPVLFAKKSKSLNLDNDLYTSVVHSYTYDRDNTLTVSKSFLTKDDTILMHLSPGLESQLRKAFRAAVILSAHRDTTCSVWRSSMKCRTKG